MLKAIIFDLREGFIAKRKSLNTQWGYEGSKLSTTVIYDDLNDSLRHLKKERVEGIEQDDLENKEKILKKIEEVRKELHILLQNNISRSQDDEVIEMSQYLDRLIILYLVNKDS